MRTPSIKIISQDRAIEDCVYLVRGLKVILDRDLAALYGVSTKRLNEQVRRNLKRFPSDFMIRLSQVEANEYLRSRSQNATLKRGENIKYLPFAFTEHGALMAADVLNSERAVRMSLYVIRAFVRLREVFAANQILEKRLAEIEKTLLIHDTALQDLYSKIKPLLLPPPEKPKGRIGSTHDFGYYWHQARSSNSAVSKERRPSRLQSYSH